MATNGELRQRRKEGVEIDTNQSLHVQSPLISQKRATNFLRFPAIALVIVFTVYLLPTKFDPKPFRYAAPPLLEGPLEVNEQLSRTKQEFKGLIHGPEAIVGYDGALYTGTADGKILKIVGQKVQVLARLGPEDLCSENYAEELCGRVLGMVIHQGYLWAIDAKFGLFKLNISTGEYENVISTQQPINGRFSKFLNDVTVSQRTGKIYMSDTSTKWRRPEFFILGLETNFEGRIIEYDPKTGSVSEVCTGISPNGIEISNDETAVLLSDTVSARVLKCNIDGPRRGQVDVLNSRIPGYPDNIRSTSRRTYWVALTAVRIASHGGMQEWIAPNIFLKEMIYKMYIVWNSRPVKMIRDLFPKRKTSPPKPKMYGLVIEIDEEGQIIRSLHDATGRIRGISHAQEINGTLYLGSAANDYIGVLDL